MGKSLFKHRSHQSEILDDEDHVPDELLNKNLMEFKMTNHLFGAKRVLLNALEKIYRKYQIDWENKTISIADLGCGGGDLLGNVANWILNKNISCFLIGIDKNEKIIQYANDNKCKLASKKANESFPSLHFETQDIFSKTFQKQHFDVICLNNVCHHFTKTELKELLYALQKQAHYAIIINDLHRHPIAYFGIKVFAAFFNLSPLARHDGPLSVLKAFTKKELIHLLEKVKAQNYTLYWRWPFRFEVIIWCK